MNSDSTMKLNDLCRLTVFVLLAGCGADQAAIGPVEIDETFDAAGREAADTIDAEYIRNFVLELSDDRYAGRGPGTDEDAAARAYIAAELAALGFQAGTEGYEQDFELVGITASQPEQWAFSSAAGGSLTLDQHEDFIVASGVQSPVAAVEDAELVFVGYGIQAPEYGWDDFAGVDLRGKVLLMLNNDPDWDEDLFEGFRRLYYGRWSYKYESAARQGAAGAIIIHTTPSAGYPWQVVQTSWTGEQFELPDTGNGERVPVQAWVTEAAARQLVALGGHDLDMLVEQARSRNFAPVELGLATSLRLENTVSRTRTANVLGVLPGTDPELAGEYVIYTAHHDHLGVGPQNGTDNIYNGARDNASGVGMVLAIGRALASLPGGTRRSVMLLLVGAEEQGLLGSEYYASSPTVEPGRIAANINYDSGNIWGRTTDITFIGLGKSSLDAVGETVAAYQSRMLKPDEFPDRGLYYRSDQFNFAKIGVPAFYFNSGVDFVDRPAGWGVEQINLYTDQHYHQPSDEYSDDWNFAGMVDDARFGFWAGRLIADADEMPAWNPGDEFEAARNAALSALE